ncbi:Gfo/Idh/MocA family oxidoreductase [bacterium]|nr:Gfo/Idh/MocA family oxidoreductase [bacterium]
MDDKVTRRDFIKAGTALTAGAVLGTVTASAKSYGRILGANDRLNFAIIGLRSRGWAHLSSIAGSDNTLVTHLCDVDRREMDRMLPEAQKLFDHTPVLEKDIRILLEDRDIDVITIATPEHWHAPMAIMGLQAGKHVYLEKPSSHNQHEGELLIEAQKKYGKLIQMGNQQRSSAHTIDVIRRIHDGLIGRPYFGKAWYANTRGSIGTGKAVPVPDYLDWELWQGPAPRRPYRDNIHPYNWHWFWHWGTGETLNNGTHEVDVCRWALDAGWPEKVTASGGRYHYRDDWEFYDTLVTSFEYADKMITWEGLSCQGKLYYDRGRGAMIHGSEGSVLIDRNGYIIFDYANKVVEEFNVNDASATMDLRGDGPLTTVHFQNMINAIRNGGQLHSPIWDGNISVTMLLHSNIAWKTGRALNIDPKTGRITGDKEAQALCRREYEKGWEPRV